MIAWAVTIDVGDFRDPRQHSVVTCRQLAFDRPPDRVMIQVGNRTYIP